MIHLPATLESDLDWSRADEEGPFFLDFGWDTTPLHPFNEGHFNAYRLAVEEWNKWKKEGTVFLGRVNGDFSKQFNPSQELEERYREFLLDENLAPTSMNYTLFCANIFSEYLQRLASFCSDEAIPSLIVFLEGLSAENVLFFCKRRFEHIHLHFTHYSLPLFQKESIGVSLSCDNTFDPSIYNALFSSLKELGLSFKCVPEELLNEHWDGIDHLIVDPGTLSETGRRMLYGFEAAGGEIVSTGERLGFSKELLLEEFLKKKKPV
ncbi:MAG: hypothetical protein KR126chlam1_01266 [Chlamydiae bacterium]|nr:hypothetical protein [Chlamydiota bacterium]